MTTLASSLKSCLLVVACALTLSSVQAAKEEWSDTLGNRFKGEPSSILGPFAVFSTGPMKARRVPLDKLAPEDCARFARQLMQKPQRASVLSETTSALSKEVLPILNRVDEKALTKVDPATLQEPELYLVVQASASNGDCWKMLGKASEILHRCNQLAPGFMDGVFLGFGHDGEAQYNMPKTMGWPGIVPKLIDQPRSGILGNCIGPSTPGILLLTRNGDPLLGCDTPNEENLTQFGTTVIDLVDLSLPQNPKSWGPRAYYLRRARPVIYAETKAAPFLIGNPLRTDGLVQRGVRLVDADLEVDEAGAVKNVTFSPESVIPEAMVRPLSDALRANMPVLPAINHGKPCAGVYHFHLDLRSASGKTTLDDLRGYKGLPIKEWLVLKPLLVAHRPRFSLKIKEVSEDETVTLAPVYVGANLQGAPSYKAQKEAFETDWFDSEEGGVLSLHPTEGAEQKIWGDTYKWKTMRSDSGIIDLQEDAGLNWVIAYAYKTLDIPEEMNAYLCMGSDDSAKVWLNGRQVYQVWANRPVVENQDIIPVHLKAGRNVLVVKVQNFIMPGWGMQMQLFLPAGK